MAASEPRMDMCGFFWISYKKPEWGPLDLFIHSNHNTIEMYQGKTGFYATDTIIATSNIKPAF